MTSSTNLTGPTTPLGVTPQGLSIWRQSDWQLSLEAGWQDAFGTNVNLAPQSINGQIIAIFAERFALLTELLEAIYQAQYPGGAEGVAVDNQLALVGLTRRAATATVTSPNPTILASGITQYGLVLFGTPGTVVPANTMLGDSASPPNAFTLDQSVTIGAAQNAQQAMVFGAAPTTGTYQLSLTLASGIVVNTAPIDYRALASQTILIFPSGSDDIYTLTLGTQTTANLYANDDPAKVAAALNTILGVTTITAAKGTLGTVIVWPAGPIPTLTATGSGIATVANSIQACINAATTGTAQPFSDVAVAGGSQAFTLSFGANTPSSGQTATSAQPIPLAMVSNNTLLANTTAVNIAVNNTVLGQPAQGIGSATASATGPISVSAGALANILTPLTGLDTITNQLPCIPGQAVETDSQALIRRAAELSASAEGPLAAILQKVQNLPNVTQALAFTNDSNAAIQVLVFSSVPTTGSYQLVLSTGTTAAIAYNASSAQVQAAIRAVSGYENALCTGSPAYAFSIDPNGANGSQAVPKISVTQNTTDASNVAIYWGRPPHSVEFVVAGGDTATIAETIYSYAPAGIATYGAAAARPFVSTKVGSNVITVNSAANLVPGQNITASGIPSGATIVTIVGLQVTMSAAATATVSNVAAVAGYAPVISDSQGNSVVVNFSRPQVVALYVSVVAKTDFYLVPGDPTSGVNPAAKWQPGSVATIQSDIVACLSQVPIGGLIVGLGTNGVRSSIRDVAGILSYDIMFDVTPNPQNTNAIQLLNSQIIASSLFNIQVTFT
jgi:hypothetical protein